jgi:hypothetical protein
LKCVERVAEYVRKSLTLPCDENIKVSQAGGCFYRQNESTLPHAANKNIPYFAYFG